MTTAQAQTKTYTRRNARKSVLYQIVVEHFEGLEEYYENNFADKYGPWRKRWTDDM